MCKRFASLLFWYSLHFGINNTNYFPLNFERYAIFSPIFLVLPVCIIRRKEDSFFFSNIPFTHCFGIACKYSDIIMLKLFHCEFLSLKSAIGTSGKFHRVSWGSSS